MKAWDLAVALQKVDREIVLRVEGRTFEIGDAIIDAEGRVVLCAGEERYLQQ